MRGTVTFVLGLQGVGKSRWIEEYMPDAVVVDIEYWWENRLNDMDRYEAANWTKIMLTCSLLHFMREGYEQIAVEMTGMTRANQAAIRALISQCRVEGYDAEIVYLRPLDFSQYLEAIEGNQGALNMFREYRLGDPKWREPTQCPYFPKGRRILVDHSSWTRRDGVTKTFRIERT